MADKKISALTSASTPLVGTEVLPIVQSGSTVKVPVSDLTAGRDVSAQSVTVNKSGMTSAASFGQFPGSTTYGQVNFNGATTLGGLSGLIGGGASGTVFINAPTGGTLNLLNGGAYVLQLGATDVTLSAGNLTQGTAAKGINFTANTGAAGMTSQLLNDYQEGTWTPAFVNGTFTYGFQSGFYTKVGRLVTVSALVTWSAKSGAGNLSITLPFTIRPSNYYRGGISLGNCNGLILNAGFTVIGSLDQSATSTDFYFLVSNAAAQQMTLNDIGSSGAIQFTATYMV